ncbi:hypothetical protein Tco_0357608 [Tanacetum coccineum]
MVTTRRNSDDDYRPANTSLSICSICWILWHDWLASHRATIDCYARTVIFGNVRQPEFVYHGSSPLKSVKAPLSSIFGKILLLFVISLIDFPNELPGLLRLREIEFGIELIPGAEPISKAPYAMALVSPGLALPLTQLMRKVLRSLCGTVLVVFNISCDASKKVWVWFDFEHGKVMPTLQDTEGPYEVNYPTHDLELACRGLVIYMLVEKKYPLKKEVLMQMLKLKLESEEDSTMALELIKFVKKLLAEHKNWLVHKQTACGKDFSNPFMVDNLPKIVRFSTHLASVVKSWLVHDQTVHAMKHWLVQKQTVFGKDKSIPLMVGSLPKTVWLAKIYSFRDSQTPFTLTYGTEAVIPAEIGMPTLRTAEVDLTKNDEALEINLDLIERKRRTSSNSRGKNNDASHAKDGRKLGPKWEGPYEVTESLGKGAYKLKDHKGNELP